MFEDDTEIEQRRKRSRRAFEGLQNEWDSIQGEIGSARDMAEDAQRRAYAAEQITGEYGEGSGSYDLGKPLILEEEDVIGQMGEVEFAPGQWRKSAFAKTKGTNLLTPIEIVKFVSLHEDGSLAESGIELKKVGMKKAEANDWITGTRIYDTPDG